MRYLLTILFIYSSVINCDAQRKVRGRDLAQSAYDSIATVIQDSIAFPVDTTALKLLNMDEGRMAYVRSGSGKGWWTVIDSIYSELYSIKATGHPTSGEQWTFLPYHVRRADINIDQAGAVGNGSTSDTLALSRAISVANGIQNIYLNPNTTYYIDADTFDINKNVRIYSDEGNRAILLGKSTNIIRSVSGCSEVVFENVIFRKFSSAHSIQTDLDKFVFKNCLFDSGGVQLLHLQTRTDEVDNIEITSCEFVSDSGGVWLRGYDYDGVRIKDNKFTNIHSYGSGGQSHAVAIHVGRDTYAHMDSSVNVWIENNTIKDVLYYGSNVNHNIMGILFYGRKAHINFNSITNIDITDTTRAGNGIEGIYVKMRFGQISFNILEDAGFSEAAIAIKGLPRGTSTEGQNKQEGFDVVCSWNILNNTSTYHATDSVSGDWRSVGIKIQTGWILVENNLIEGFTDMGIETSTPDGLDNIVIRDNIIINLRGLYGIRVRHGGEYLKIISNDIITPTGEFEVGSLYGMYLNPSDTLKGVMIKDNFIYFNSTEQAAAASYGIRFVTGVPTYIDINLISNQIDLDESAQTTTAFRMDGSSYDVIRIDGNIVTNCDVGFNGADALSLVVFKGNYGISSANHRNWGSGTFTTTATIDTVLITGVLTTDIFFLTKIGATPDSLETLSYTRNIDTLFVRRSKGVTNNLGYSWERHEQ